MLAAQRLNPDNLEGGYQLVEQAIVDLKKKSDRAFSFFIALLVVSFIMSLTSGILLFSFIFQNPNSPAYITYLIFFLTSFFVMVFSATSIRWFQTRKFLFVKTPYDVVLPAELELLMSDLRSGRLSAYTSAGYGNTVLSAVQAPDGVLLDGRISPETFSNRYSPLLLSRQAKFWGLFWLSFRRSFTRPIYVVPDTVPDGDEAPCLNTDPRFRWLVGGTMQEFMAYLDAFLRENISPDDQPWYRTAFTVARREMRKGAQHGALAAAIKVIKQELVVSLGSDLGPQGGDSTSSLKALLSGRQGRKDIKGYFDPRGS
ncbi:hypothetical protein HLH29_00370 [Gluconacetobacter tumulicola]|uniref:Uncharacterized protein n=1 Tax=Gluconacetobacter tumulicola TaxID=1017177 RepID=A0A7W4JAE8_9PROT|nr:hypothetical protein [Gluconacetobacter tumulicola]